MLSWLNANISTILIALVLLAVVVWIVCRLFRDRKKGKSSCGCGCAHCTMADCCHKRRSAVPICRTVYFSLAFSVLLLYHNHTV